MGYLICSMALVILILTMPVIFGIERDSIAQEMAQRELTEIADYTSNTLANLFYLANSTVTTSEISLTKDLLYLPLTVENNLYVLTITSTGGNASKVTAYLRDSPSIMGSSWLVPGLKVEDEYSLEIGGKSVVASCYRYNSDFYVSLEYKE